MLASAEAMDILKNVECGVVMLDLCRIGLIDCGCCDMKLLFRISLIQRGFKLRNQLKQAAHVGQPLPHTLYCLEATNQVKGLHTFIR